jgi:cardiolipin synthase A/B
MHAKMIVVDKQKAFVGSQNLTAEALDRSREVGLIIANQAVINTLCSSFAQDWGRA